jgi:signal transduction histidine kinase/CheY-like chemotaxis protein
LVVLLASPDGRLIARSPRGEGVRAGQPISETRGGLLRTSLTGEATILSKIDGATRLAAWRRIAPYPVVAIGALRQDVALAAWWHNLWQGVVVALLVLLALCVLGARLQRAERKRLEATEEAMRRLRALTEASHEIGAILAPRPLANRAASLMRDLLGCAQVSVTLVPESGEGQISATVGDAQAAASGVNAPSLALPLTGDDGRVMGIVVLRGRAEDAPFSEAERELARQFARLVALTLAGVRLLMELADKARDADHKRDEALAEKRYFTSLLEGFREGFAAFGADQRMTLCNPAFAALTVRGTDGDLVGRRPDELIPGLGAALAHANARGAVAEAPFDFSPEGDDTVLEFRVGPLPAGFALFVRDVTQQRLAELRQRQENRLEAIGQLAGGIAHDFNNLLTVIIGNTEMLADDMAPDTTARQRLELIERAAEQASGLTSRLLAFARVDYSAPTPIDVAAVLGDFMPLLRTAVGEGAAITLALDDDVWPALANAGELRNAVLNLVLNARDASPAGGPIRITAGNAIVRPGEIGGFMAVPGEFVKITVEDHGTGMTDEVRRRAFEPFFTTKTGGRGNGHGLAIVYGFVRNCGGHVDIMSTEGAGTTVRMYLPHAAQTLPDPLTQLPPIGGMEHLLVVEDEPDVRRQITEMLRDLGYRVVSYGSASAAIGAIEAGLRPDGVVSDVMLSGGESGLALVQSIEARLPGTPTLLISGHVDPGLLSNDPLEAMPRVLMKPFRRRVLAARVREILDRQADPAGSQRGLQS